MVKKRGLIVGITIVFILACMNLFMFFNHGNLSYSTISGKAILNIPLKIPHLNTSIIIFALEWIILILIAIFLYSSFLKHKKNYLTQQDYHVIKQKKSKSETDLDVLYDLLKNKKKLNLENIEKVFGITKEKALEWGKILEDHDLVTIEYPTFRNPEVKIKEIEIKKELKESKIKKKEIKQKIKEVPKPEEKTKNQEIPKPEEKPKSKKLEKISGNNEFGTISYPAFTNSRIKTNENQEKEIKKAKESQKAR